MERRDPLTPQARFSGSVFPALLGIIGPKGSGKSTLADTLIQQLDDESMGQRIRFAGPLKAMIRTLLLKAGIEYPSQYIDGHQKEVEIDEFPVPGITGRHLLQTLGTEWGREHIDKEVWCSIGVDKACRARSEGKLAIIDDVRFPNEAKAIRWRGGSLVRVDRPGYEWGEDSHASEGAVASIQPEYIVDNL